MCASVAPSCRWCAHADASRCSPPILRGALTRAERNVKVTTDDEGCGQAEEGREEARAEIAEGEAPGEAGGEEARRLTHRVAIPPATLCSPCAGGSPSVCSSRQSRSPSVPALRARAVTASAAPSVRRRAGPRRPAA